VSICTELDEGEFRLVETSLIEEETRKTEEGPQIPLEVISIQSEKLHFDLQQEVKKLAINCLILPSEADSRIGTCTAALHDHLLGNIECEIVLLTPGERPPGMCREIIVPVSEGPHSASCLRMANDVARVSCARLVALHVEPELDEVSPQAAMQTLSRAVDRALEVVEHLVQKRVVMSPNVIDGIKQTIGESSDLIILGLKRRGLVKRFVARGVAERLVNTKSGPAIAVVQSAMPLSSTLVHWIDAILRGNVPQLPREERVSLVERIQLNSRWDFDLIMLICLSTVIAAGGLIQNSAAVVIGAMLVAPLMTPLLGTGLSLIQGNVILFRSTLLTVLRGFVVAFFISWLVAMLVSPEVTSEMAARGSPRVLDIAVAMVGGIAAAYATGRPNLLSALPGVAIAASLVPPVATSGIAVWLGDFSLAIGSALLFLSNIVTIILGTAMAFRAVGIRGMHEHGAFNRWTAVAGTALLGTMLALGIYESLPSAQVSGEIQRTLAEIAGQDDALIKAMSREKN